MGGDPFTFYYVSGVKDFDDTMIVARLFFFMLGDKLTEMKKRQHVLRMPFLLLDNFLYLNNKKVDMLEFISLEQKASCMLVFQSIPPALEQKQRWNILETYFPVKIFFAPNDGDAELKLLRKKLQKPMLNYRDFKSENVLIFCGKESMITEKLRYYEEPMFRERALAPLMESESGTCRTTMQDLV